MMYRGQEYEEYVSPSTGEALLFVKDSTITEERQQWITDHPDMIWLRSADRRR